MNTRNDVSNLSDENASLDLLQAVKTAIHLYAMALTEIRNSTVRTVLIRQLQDNLSLHEEITTLMVRKGWLQPYNFNQQILLDMHLSSAALHYEG
jgi:spore coat protein CotF